MGAMRIERISAETEFDWEKKRAALIQIVTEFPKFATIKESTNSRLSVTILDTLNVTLDRPPLQPAW